MITMCDYYASKYFLFGLLHETFTALNKMYLALNCPVIVMSSDVTSSVLYLEETWSLLNDNKLLFEPG